MNTSPDKVKSRLTYMDNIKGLLIFLVVFAHCLYDFRSGRYISFLVIAIYYVHMPAFVFTSGYFSKSRNARSIDSYLKFILSYLFIISIYIVRALINGDKVHLLYTYYSEWYMIALVIWRVLSPYLKRSKWTVLGLTCFALVAGYWSDLGGTGILAINKIVTFFPFFFAGLLCDSDSLNRIRGKGFKARAMGVVLLVLVSAGIISSYKVLSIKMRDVLPRAYPEATLGFALNRIVIFAIAAAFIIAILQLSPDRSIPLLTKAGKNCFAIYLIHRPFTLIFSSMFESGEEHVQLIAAVVFSIIAIIIMGSDFIAGYLNKFLGICVESLTVERSHRYVRAAILLFLTLLLTIPAILKIIGN